MRCKRSLERDRCAFLDADTCRAVRESSAANGHFGIRIGRMILRRTRIATVDHHAARRGRRGRTRPAAAASAHSAARRTRARARTRRFATTAASGGITAGFVATSNDRAQCSKTNNSQDRYVAHIAPSTVCGFQADRLVTSILCKCRRNGQGFWTHQNE